MRLLLLSVARKMVRPRPAFDSVRLAPVVLASTLR